MDMDVVVDATDCEIANDYLSKYRASIENCGSGGAVAGDAENMDQQQQQQQQQENHREYVNDFNVDLLAVEKEDASQPVTLSQLDKLPINDFVVGDETSMEVLSLMTPQPENTQSFDEVIEAYLNQTISDKNNETTTSTTTTAVASATTTNTVATNTTAFAINTVNAETNTTPQYFNSTTTTAAAAAVAAVADNNYRQVDVHNPQFLNMYTYGDVQAIRKNFGNNNVELSMLLDECFFNYDRFKSQSQTHYCDQGVQCYLTYIACQEIIETKLQIKLFSEARYQISSDLIYALDRMNIGIVQFTFEPGRIAEDNINYLIREFFGLSAAQPKCLTSLRRLRTTAPASSTTTAIITAATAVAATTDTTGNNTIIFEEGDDAEWIRFDYTLAKTLFFINLDSRAIQIAIKVDTMVFSIYLAPNTVLMVNNIVDTSPPHSSLSFSSANPSKIVVYGIEESCMTMSPNYHRIEESQRRILKVYCPYSFEFMPPSKMIQRGRFTTMPLCVQMNHFVHNALYAATILNYLIHYDHVIVHNSELPYLGRRLFSRNYFAKSSDVKESIDVLFESPELVLRHY